MQNQDEFERIVEKGDEPIYWLTMMIEDNGAGKLYFSGEKENPQTRRSLGSTFVGTLEVYHSAGASAKDQIVFGFDQADLLELQTIIQSLLVIQTSHSARLRRTDGR